MVLLHSSRENLGDELLGVAPFLADTGDDLALEEVARDLVGEAVGLGFVGLLGAAGEESEERLLLAFEFGEEEAVLVEAAHLGEEESGGLVDAVLLGGAIEGEVVGLAHVLGDVAVAAGRGAHEGSRGLLGEIAETLVDHAGDEGSYERLAEVGHGTHVGLRVLQMSFMLVAVASLSVAIATSGSVLLSRVKTGRGLGLTALGCWLKTSRTRCSIALAPLRPPYS